jgi:hypothetical protein
MSSKRAGSESLPKKLLAELRLMGVSTIQTQYSGEGDSGDIDGAQFHTAQGEELAVPADIRIPVDRFFETFLNDHEAGYEIDSGSFGEFVLDLSTMELTHTHNVRLVQYDTSTGTFKLTGDRDMAVEFDENGYHSEITD